MSNYNNAFVPWYAHSDTKAIRPYSPRELEFDELQERIHSMKMDQAYFNWIRKSFEEGDYIYFDNNAPKEKTFNLGNRYCIFKYLKNSIVKVEWLDNGHKLNPLPSHIYRYGHKLDKITGEEIILSKIKLS